MGDKDRRESDKGVSALPELATLRFCAQSARKTLDIFSAVLKQNGVSDEVIQKSITMIQPELKESIKQINDGCRSKINNILERREMEDRRQDYFGRALLYGLENDFPVDENTTAIIVAELVEGVIPREVCEGLIKALKSALGDEELETFEKKSNDLAEEYRDKTTGLIDTDKFIEDAKMIEIASKTINKFRVAFEGKDESSRKEWLVNIISTTDSFKKMKRDLRDSEYDQIVRHLFA